MKDAIITILVALALVIIIQKFMGTSFDPPGLGQNGTQLWGDVTIPKNTSVFSPNRKYRVVIQSDGNFVLYNSENQAKWASGTNATFVTDAKLRIDNRGVLHVLRGALFAGLQEKWSSQKGSDSCPCRLQVLDSGLVIVLDKNKQIVWSAPRAPSNDEKEFIAKNL